ncbi:MAG: hypothetical protein FWE09_00060 [Treponema sp.]|nr:hypothetical protein [Treponema sp.]
MQVVDKIEPRDGSGEMDEERRDDLFTSLIMGKDATEEAKTSRGAFTVKYPKPADILRIGRLAAARRNHRPPESLDDGSEAINVMASTLDVVVVKGPAWFESARKADPEFSFLNLPCRGLLAELYGKAHSFREEVERRLAEAGGNGDRPVPSQEGAADAVDGGAFGGLSGQRGDTGA